MVTRPHLLILEDSALDAELMLQHLSAAGIDVEWKRVETEEEYLTQLTLPLDLILSDYNLPSFDGLHALKLLQERNLDVPFILVSGALGEEKAVAALHQGADDFILKNSFARLGHAVSSALDRKRLRDERVRAEVELRGNEERFRALIEHATDAIILLGAEGTVLWVSAGTIRMLGGSAEYWLAGNWLNRVHPDDVHTVRSIFAQLLQDPETSRISIVFRKSIVQRTKFLPPICKEVCRLRHCPMDNDLEIRFIRENVILAIV